MSDLVRVAHVADQYRVSRESADRDRERLISVIRSAHAAGASEYALAKAAGVTRNTVRSWLGKGGA